MIHSPGIPLLIVESQPLLEDDCACASIPQMLTVGQNSCFENDCACPPTTIERLAPQKEHIYRQAVGIYHETLLQDYYLAFNPYAPQGPCVLNRPAWERWQSFSRPQHLSLPIDFLLAEQNLLVPQGHPVQSCESQPNVLTVWLHVTNACNLDCPYCYVRKSSAYMNDDVGIQAVEKIFQTAQRYGFKGIKLKYAGGEAALHFDLIRKMAEHAQKIALQTGLALDQVVLSNGTLLRAKDVAWMLENRIRLMISLDGRGEVHDRMRPTRNGKGSFSKVNYTVDHVLLPAGLRPSISITVTRINYTGVSDAVRWALERNLQVSLNFYRHPLTSKIDLAAEEEALIQGMLDAYRVFEEFLPEQPFFNGLLDRVRAGRHSYACGIASSYLVITHEGKVAQCHMLLDHPDAPPMSDDLLAQVKHGPIQMVSVDEKSICSTCQYRYFCAGGCPLETYRTTGRWDVPHPSCRVYKTLLPVALRLEGLRLLKKHGYLS